MYQGVLRLGLGGVLLLSCLVALGGCGGSTAVPVSGKVTQDGQPLTTGSVTFHPDASKGNSSGGMPVGPISAEGTYRLVDGGKNGVPSGWYKVTVNATVPSNPKDEYSLPKSLINKKFTDPSTTPFSIEVKPNAPAGAYDLTVTK